MSPPRGHSGCPVLRSCSQSSSWFTGGWQPTQLAQRQRGGLVSLAQAGLLGCLVLSLPLFTCSDVLRMAAQSLPVWVLLHAYCGAADAIKSDCVGVLCRGLPQLAGWLWQPRSLISSGVLLTMCAGTCSKKMQVRWRQLQGLPQVGLDDTMKFDLSPLCRHMQPEAEPHYR